MFNGSKEVRERLERAENGLREVRADFDTYRQRQALEWEELLDKVRRWMQRTGARERAEARAEAVAQPGPNQTNAYGQAQHLDPVSAQLVARRGRSLRALPSAEEGEGDQVGLPLR